jgi:hypothetical protein
VHLEGLKVSPEAAASGLTRARAKIDSLIPRQAAA